MISQELVLSTARVINSLQTVEFDTPEYQMILRDTVSRGLVKESELEDSIKIIADYATAQGSKNGGKYYGNCKRALYKVIGLSSKMKKEGMSILDRNKLILAQEAFLQEVKNLVNNKPEDYHDYSKLAIKAAEEAISILKSHLN